MRTQPVAVNFGFHPRSIQGKSRVASGMNSGADLGVGISDCETDSLAPIDSYDYDDSIVRKFAGAMLLWGIVATLIGLGVAHLLVIPKMFGGSESLSFARLRPLHSSVALYAFLGNGVFAAIYYSLQRLCAVRIWSSVLAQLHFWSWQAIIVTAIWTLPKGFSQGRSSAELIQPINLAIVLVWILFFGVNYWMTLRRRRVQRIYVSLWFYTATLVTVPVLLTITNIVLPVSWVKSYPLLAGVHDAVVQWCYGQMSNYYLLLMPFLGMMYFFIPLFTGKPIHSHRLAVTHFWALAILILWTGPHHLNYTAAPEWLASVGMLAGLLMWMPLWGGLINGWKTLRSGEARFSDSLVYRFFACSLIFYGITTFESAVLSMKSVSALTQYSDWTIAHLHNGMMGWNGMLAFGIIYWLVPRLFNVNLWSQRAAAMHFWIALVGVLLSVIPLYLSGFTQSMMWNSLDELGNLAYPDFIESIEASRMMWWIRILGGLLYLVGLILMTANFALTWLFRVKESCSTLKDSVEDILLPDSSSSYQQSPTSGTLDNVPVLDTARSLEKWSHLEWHRDWEFKPSRFVILPILGLLIVGVVQLMPVIFSRASVPKIASVKPYTPLELLGRELYLEQGCYQCHTQMVRPLVAETKRYGDYSRAGEFVYDFPPFWGKRRIGPDLAREGGNKQTSLWHWRHLDNPVSLVEGTVMPSYSHLLDAEIDFEKVTNAIRAAKLVGVAYDEEMEVYVQDARDQAERVAADIVSTGGSIQRGDVLTLESQGVALIAYLQRLGTDLNAPVTDGKEP